MDAGFTRFEILTIGTALYLCLGFVCVFVEAQAIEERLAVEAHAAANDVDGVLWTGAEASGQSVTLSGAAVSRVAAEKARQAVSSIAGLTTLEDEMVIVGDHSGCQRALNRRLKHGPIEFDAKTHELSEDSFGVLEDPANITTRCRGTLQVAAHMGTRGDAEVNLKLSKRRAQAVAKYLVSAGVPVDRLVAEGFGETQPVVLSEEGERRSANERVEIRVIGDAA